MTTTTPTIAETLDSDHAERLQAMVAPDQETWDLSPNDVAAIQWALDRIDDLENDLIDKGLCS